jgi:protein-S-isoprenylcysteine O-methyltransferase Ste14
MDHFLARGEMLTGVYQSATILATAITFYVMDTRLMRCYDPKREYGSSRNWVYTAVAAIAGIIIIAQPILLPQLGLHTAAWWGLLVQALGLTAIVGGLALHWWARMHLGQFYAERSTDIQQEQYLVDTGPYAYVRHPIYTSYFMLITGFLLVSPALPTLIAAIYTLADFSLAPRREEKLLIQNVPGYADYMDRTPCFFPRFQRLGRRQMTRKPKTRRGAR